MPPSKSTSGSHGGSGRKDASSTLSLIKDTVGDLLHLNVITAVGDVPLTADQSDFAPGSLDKTDKVFTRMGLLDGDIKTAISSVFVTDPAHAAVRDFHQEMVELGMSTVEQNIEALKKLVVLLKNELDAE